MSEKKCSFYTKDQSEKKVTNVDGYISVIFSHILINFVRLEKQISVAFQRGTLYLCTFPMEETMAIPKNMVDFEMS